MVEQITPNSKKFAQAVWQLETQTAGMLANILEKTSGSIGYKTVYNPEKNSRTVLFFLEEEKIDVVNLESAYQLISPDDTNKFFPSHSTIPKPIALIDIHEINNEIVVLDSIEIEKSLKWKGVWLLLLTQLENVIREKWYIYLLSIHYHEDSRGFFERHWFTRATESEIASYPEVQVYTTTEQAEWCIVLTKKL